MVQREQPVEAALLLLLPAPAVVACDQSLSLWAYFPGGTENLLRRQMRVVGMALKQMWNLARVRRARVLARGGPTCGVDLYLFLWEVPLLLFIAGFTGLGVLEFYHNISYNSNRAPVSIFFFFPHRLFVA